jgi:hypothetical protein
MPAIAASGQVYVLNGAITVTSGSGGYLATGSPLMYIQSLVCPIGVTSHTFTIPSGARAIVMNSARSLTKCAISAYGASTLLNCLFVTSNGSGPLAAQLPTATDTQVTVQITNGDVGSQTLYFWWAFSLDDYGSTSLNQANTYRPPLGYGKYSMIANDRVPVRLGDDSQDPQSALATSVTPNSSGTLIAAPGAGNTLVIWQSNMRCVAAGGEADLAIQDTNNQPLNWITTNSFNFSNMVHGGIRLGNNVGLIWVAANFIGSALFACRFTTEVF